MDEFDGGVAFASVVLAFLFGLYHHIFKGIDFGLQWYEEFGLEVGFDREGLGFVSDHSELEGGESLLVLYGEIAVEVAGSSDGGACEDYLDEGEGLAGVGVDHAAGYARYTCPQPDGEQDKRQQHNIFKGRLDIRQGVVSDRIRLCFCQKACKGTPFFRNMQIIVA